MHCDSSTLILTIPEKRVTSSSATWHRIAAGSSWLTAALTHQLMGKVGRLSRLIIFTALHPKVYVVKVFP